MKYHHTHTQFVLIKAVCIVLILITNAACMKPTKDFSPEQREEMEMLVEQASTIDSLELLVKKMEADQNALGTIIAMREYGRKLRGKSQFSEALEVHKRGLQLTREVNDTLEWVRALNNIGTDYRRLNAFDDALEYHFLAFKLSEVCADTSASALKNRVMALNGLGNIYMEIEDYASADSVLRMALEGERRLNSTLGQAINYANLGAIFEHRMMLDSAWVCYRKSMECNQALCNIMGQALCHMHFGQLLEIEGRYSQAKSEYEEAYALMQQQDDQWHAIVTLVRLAGIHHLMADDAQALALLSKGKQEAEQMELVQSLADIHNLYYQIYKHQGRSKEALAAYEVATAMRDSAMNLDKLNRTHRTSFNIERNEHATQIENIASRENDRRARLIIVLFLVTTVLGSAIGFLYYLYKQRKRRQAEMQELMNVRENFFANITHEFRTPLTIILGQSHDLQAQEGISPKAAEQLQAIERQGKGLLTLVNQLLDISKVRFSAGSIDWKNGDLAAYIAMIIETYRLHATQKGIDLQFEGERCVEMDFVPDYINKVLNNLLSNALKFTPEGGSIKVSISRIANRLHVSVADTGMGMSATTMKYAFTPFFQGPQESKNIGTGIGLALVKQIIDTLKGSITVESTEGEGTTFHLSLPIHNHSKEEADFIMEDSLSFEDDEDQSTTTLRDSTASRNAHTLLIVEDNSDIAAYIGAQFEGKYNVAYATNGAEGMSRALDLLPDLIITDLSMPGMDGMALCRQVRANEIVNHIPIIVVTANAAEKQRIAGIKAGANAYLAKPFNSEELCSLVEQLLLERQLMREKFAQSLPTSQPEPAPALTEEQSNATTDIDIDDIDRRFVQKLNELLDTSLSMQKEVNVGLLAEHVCMSQSQLYRKLQAVTGYSPSVYIQRFKIGRAKAMIDADPNVSLQEVAFECGFDIYTSFSRAFKNVCGIAAKEYQEQSRK